MVTVVRNREPGVTLARIADVFGIHPIELSSWLKRGKGADGVRLGITSAESAELREANKRIRLLEQEAEVLKCALAYVWQGSIRGKDSSRS